MPVKCLIILENILNKAKIQKKKKTKAITHTHMSIHIHMPAPTKMPLFLGDWQAQESIKAAVS